MNRKKKEWMKAAKARQKAARLASATARAEAERRRAGSGTEADLPLAEVFASVEAVADEALSLPPAVDPVVADALLARAGLEEARGDRSPFDRLRAGPSPRAD